MRLDSELAKQTEALRVADRRKDEFLAMLAHELRNPLAPIRSGLDLLKADRPGCDTIQIMQHQVEHLVKLVDDLLDVSRVMRGRIQLQRKPVTVNSLIIRATEVTQPVLDLFDHHFTADVPSQGIWIHADEVRVCQIITNLLNNAAKYTPSGGNIHLRVIDLGHEVRISIKDDGIGIEPRYIPEMFELFSQSARTLDRSAGGLGVGLTVVNQLVELHNGTISVYSDGLNQGSEFVVTLPTIPTPTESGQRARTTEASRDELAEESKRILVVDDLTGTAKILKRLIRRFWNHEVELAHDGETACALAEEYRPDIILLDIGLPGMNGYEVAENLRTKQHFANTRIIAISGYGTILDRQKSKAAGIDAHYVKPIGVDQLNEILGDSQRIADFNLASDA